MARKARVCFPGAIYHVMARGNERARFFHAREDYELFLEALEQAQERFEVRLHAYCLMPNHFHLALETPQGNLSRFMAWLQTTFTLRYNRNHKRSGHLFQGRYRAELVERSEYGRWLIFYLHLNPIRSRAKGSLHYVGDMAQLNRFPWSSHQAYAGLKPELKHLSLDWLAEWGQRPAAARKAYLKALKAQINAKEPLDWKEQIQIGLVAGSEELVKKACRYLEGKGREVGREQRGGLELKNRREKLARILDSEIDPRNCVWIRVRLLGESQVKVAKELGYKSSIAVHQIAKRVEERAGKDVKLQRKLSEWKCKML